MAGKPQEAGPELDLEPRLKVKRLNRFAVLIAAMLGIIVLWVAYFVLSQRTPIAPQARDSQRAMEPERLALEHLQREALRQAAPEPYAGLRPAAAAERPRAPRRPTRPDPSASASSQKLRRALDADVLAPGFRRDVRAAQPREDSPGEAEAIQHALNALDTETANENRHSAQLEKPLSPFVIQAGTLIPAILTGGIHSDLPGQTQALVRRNVYDSISGRHLMIPQGARLIGSYDSRIAWGQKRILLAWDRLILPDGRSLDLAGMPGADLAAMAGVRDKVNNHFVRTFGSALLLSAVSAGSQLSQPQESADGGAPSARQIAAAALGQELGRAAAEITRRNVDLEPTLEIRPGYLLNVEVTADLTFPGPYREDG